MAEQRQVNPSEEIKVSVTGGVTFIDHSDAYNAQMERFLAGEKLNRQELLAKDKLIASEEAQMELARRDPETYLKQQQARLSPAPAEPVIHAQHQADAKLLHASPPQEQNPDPAIKADQGSQAERLARAKQAFEDASPDDKAIAVKNLEGIQKKLQEVPYMTPEFLVQAQQKAFVDEGAKLYERNLAANKEANALTFEVANFSQGAGKTMVNADAGFGLPSGAGNYSADIHHGLDAKAVGLTLAEVNAGATTNDAGEIGAGVGLRAVKQGYGAKERKVFVAAGLNANAAGLSSDNPALSGAATVLGVHTHETFGRPTSEIAGAVVDLETGNTTAVASASTMFNADTKYATTARAVGTYNLNTEAAGFTLEAYQQTGIKGLTARLSTSVNNLGEENDVSVGAGVSYGF